MKRRITAGLLTALVCALGVSCTTPHQVEEVETEMEATGRSSEGTIGKNSDDQLIIQQKRKAEHELESQIWANNALQNEMQTEVDELLNCREAIADPGVGGNGEVLPIPAIDNWEKQPVNETMGMDESGNLVVVKKEFFDERYNYEKKKTGELRRVKTMIKKHRRDCERRLRFMKANRARNAAAGQDKS